MSKKYKILFIVLVLISVLSLGYVVYDLFFFKENCKVDKSNITNKEDNNKNDVSNCLDDCNENVIDLDESYDSSVKNVSSKSYKDYIININKSITSLKTAATLPDGGNAQANIYDSLDINNDGIASLERKNNELKVTFTDDTFGDLYKDKYGEEKILSQNVIDFGYIISGQDCKTFIWFIDNKGTLYYADGYPEDKDPLQIKKSDAKNVINVITIDYLDGGSFLPIGVTYDGDFIEVKQKI